MSTQTKKPKHAPRPGLAFMRRIHELHRKLDERAFYPKHDKRTASSAYRRVHCDLVVTKNLPCLVCGVTNSILEHTKKGKDPRFNPYAARQIETHHHTIEWALANAIDTKKFNERIVRRMRLRPTHDPIYARDFTKVQVHAWIDHHPDNLWVLCDVHHRHRWVGIHAISGPIWGAQDLLTRRFARHVSRALSPR
jgi:hypothetical protein